MSVATSTRVDETCVPDLAFGGFSSRLDLAAETKAELTSAFGYSTGYKLYAQQEHFYNVPSLSTSSGFEQLPPPLNSGSLGNSSLRSSLAHLPDFSNADEAARPAARPLMDGEVPEMELDSRKGSPCRQAAAELMEPSGSDFTERTHSLEFSPSFSHSLMEQYDQQETRGQHGLAGRRSADEPAGEPYPSCPPLPPLPDLSKQPDWFTAVVEQAQSVGLWGGRPVERKPPRGPSESERPILPDHLLSRAATGVGDRQLADAGPPPAYAWGMASFLAMQQDRQAAMQSQGQSTNLGHFPQQHQQIPDSQTPRFQPVSLGMSAVYMQPGHFAASRKPGMNDGPFRPPTRALPGTQSAGDLDVTNTPMLRQSKMQLSLGLGSDHAIDLKHWGYGNPCSGEPSVRADSKATEELRVVPQASQGVQLSLSVPAAAAAPAHSASTNAGSAPTSPSRRRPAEAAAPVLAMAQDRSVGSPASHKRKAEAAEAGDGQSKPLEGMSRSLGGEEASIRAECLERYREKKQRRLFCKTIRYHKRKVNADKRPRIKGRFLKATTEGSGEAKAEEQPALSGSLNEAQDTIGSDCAADEAGGKTEAAAGETAASSEM